SQTDDLSIDLQSASVTLRTSHVHSSNPWENVRELIGRLLSCPDVEAVIVNRSESSVTLSIQPPSEPGIEFAGRQPLRAVAQSFRVPSQIQYRLDSAYRDCDVFRISKLNGLPVAGRIVFRSLHRIRLSHPLLRANPSLARQVARLLSLVPGVK